MSRKNLHVVPKDGKWSVRRTGSSRSSGIYNTQREAVEKAMQIARNQHVELYIHGRDGRIRERNSYSRDPYPPKG